MVNYLVIFLFAGHGLLKDGQQVLVVNEFDQKTSFYKFFMAENTLRNLAEVCPNAYLVGIFACCRQIYDKDQMEGKGIENSNRATEKAPEQKRVSSQMQVDFLNKLFSSCTEEFYIGTESGVKINELRGGDPFAIQSHQSIRQNVLLMWGCKPTKSVGKATQMVRDVVGIFEHQFNPQTLMLPIP